MKNLEIKKEQSSQIFDRWKTAYLTRSLLVDFMFNLISIESCKCKATNSKDKSLAGKANFRRYNF